MSRGSGRADTLAGLFMALAICAPTLRAVWGIGGALYVASGSGLLAIALGRVMRRGAIPTRHLGYLALFALWVVWMWTSILWTISTVQFGEDFLLLALLLVLMGAGSIALTPRGARRAVDWILIGALLTVAWTFLGYFQSGTLRGYDTDIAEYYLVTAQLIGIGTVGALARAVTSDRALVWWVLSGILGVGLSLSLARGALLAVVLIAVMLGLYGRSRVRSGRAEPHDGAARSGGRETSTRLLALLRDRLLVGIVMAGFAFLAVRGAMQVERTAARLQRLFSGGEFGRGFGGTRDWLWNASWNAIGEAPFLGSGLGSSGRAMALEEGSYPHNLFLQVWMEGGLPGVLLLAAVVVVPIRLALRARHRVPREEWLPVLAIFVFLVLEYSKSTSIYSGRPLFLTALLLVVVALTGTDRDSGAEDAVAKENGGGGARTDSAPPHADPALSHADSRFERPMENEP